MKLWFIIRNMYLVFVPLLTQNFYNPCDFLSGENHTSVFVINKVTSGKHLRIGGGCLEGQPCDYRVRAFSPTHWPLGRGKGGRLNQLPEVNDLINHTCIMKLPLKTKPNKRTRFREFSGWWIYRNFRRVEHRERAWVLCTLSPCLTLCISSNWMCLSYIILW